jgi:hypothetical protein
MAALPQIERYLEAWETGVYKRPGPFEKALATETRAYFEEWLEPLLTKPGRVSTILTKLADRLESIQRPAPDHRSQRRGKGQCIPSSDLF